MNIVDRLAWLSEAPGGIQHARALVLRLAVEGVLAGQSGRVNGLADVESIDPVDPPHQLADGWVWTRLGLLGSMLGGGTPSKREAGYWDGDVPWVSPKDMKRLRIAMAIDSITERAVAETSVKIIPTGSVLMVTRGMILAHSFPVALTTAPVTINQDMKALVLEQQELAEFVLLALRGHKARMLGKVQRSSHGTCRLPTGDVKDFLLALPPLAEQRRIVAKVGELMALCDELEERQNERRQTRRAFTTSALHALTTAEDTESRSRAWTRVRDNWETVVGAARDAERVLDAVRGLAVQGRLKCDASPTTMSGQQLVEAAREVRAVLVSQKKLRAPRLRATPPSADAPFDVPDSWVWARFADVCDVAGGMAKGRRLAGRKVKTLPYLRVANVQAGYLNLEVVKLIDVPVDEVEKYALRPGDVLLTEGGDWDKLGRSAVWAGEVSPCAHQNHVFRARPLVPTVRSEWLSLYTNSPPGRTYFQGCAKRTTNLASINMTELRNCPVPIPPTQVQDAILSLLEQLSTLCGDVENLLDKRDAVATSLATAIAAASAPAQDQAIRSSNGSTSAFAARA